MGVEDEVLTGMSGSRLLQPSEFIESRNEFEAMMCRVRLQEGAALGLALTLSAAYSNSRIARRWPGFSSAGQDRKSAADTLQGAQRIVV